MCIGDRYKLLFGLCFLNYIVFRLDIISDGLIRIVDKNKSVRIFNVRFWGGLEKK